MTKQPARDVEWLVERGGLMCRFDAVRPAQTALVVIDMQDVFVNPQYKIGSPATRAIIPNINRLSARVRKEGGTVVFTRHTSSVHAPFSLPIWLRETEMMKGVEALFQSGTASHGLNDALDIDDEDIIIDKYRYSAFLDNSSNIHFILREMGIDTIIVAGTVTNCCCESTARDAHMLDYRVFFRAMPTRRRQRPITKQHC